jgi:hypothetical protein
MPMRTIHATELPNDQCAFGSRASCDRAPRRLLLDANYVAGKLNSLCSETAHLDREVLHIQHDACRHALRMGHKWRT